MLILRSFNRSILLSLALLGLSFSSVHASLVGDTVDAGIFSSNNRINGFGLDLPFIVTADDSDAILYSDVFVLDVHADGFSMDYTDTTNNRGWSSTTNFRLFDLDWVNDPSGKITGLTIDTNISNWVSTMASFGDDFVTINLADLVIPSDTYFDVTFITNHSAVPVPAAVWLFGTALMGLVGFGKRRQAT